MRGKMYLAYESQNLRALCEQEDLATQEWGSKVARKLFNRIGDIYVARRISDLSPAGSPQIVRQDLREQLLIRLDKDICLFLVPLPIPAPLDKDGQVVWDRISRLKILKIGVSCDQ